MNKTDEPVPSLPARGLERWLPRTPATLLLLMAAAMPLSFSTWQALLNNFAVEVVQFNGEQIGWLQSLREVPGFLAFTAIFWLLFFREQTFALLSLLVLGLGVMLTGLFPSAMGLYATTVLMSLGFHYYETMQQSLNLQWLKKEESAHGMGRQISAKAFTSLLAFGLIWLLLEFFHWPYAWIYLAGGGLTVALALLAWLWFPRFEAEHLQHKHLLMRKRYWLYYALTFMGGARRQIFVVFAGFLMVSRFGYSAADMSLLLLANHLFNTFLASRVGRLIGRIGERRALILEYLGLIAVFSGYALTDTAWVAAALFLLDHLFFSFVIAQRTYFQKIADPRDMASTAGVAFTINHIAAVVLPAALGALWVWSPAAVFWCGTGMAVISLGLSLLVPEQPEPGRETVFARS